MTDNHTNGTEKTAERNPIRTVFDLWNKQPLCQMALKSFPAEHRENLDTLLFEAFEAGAHATIRALEKNVIKVVKGMNPELDAALEGHIASKPTIN